MYIITKVPAPRGYRILNKPVEVNSVTGLNEVYDADGELRGKYSDEIETPFDISIKYQIYYNDESDKVYTFTKEITDINKDFSLSEAPFSSYPKWYITSVDIVVMKETREVKVT